MAPKQKVSAKKTYDYSGLKEGMRVHAESEGQYYAAEVVAVSTSAKRAKAPVKVSYLGYEGYDEWLAGDRLRSKALTALASSDVASTARPATNEDGIRRQPSFKLAAKLVVDAQDAKLVYEALAKDGKITKDMFANFCMKDLHLDLSTEEADRVYNSMVPSAEAGDVTKEQWEDALRSSARFSAFLAMSVRNFKHRKLKDDFKVADNYNYSKPTNEVYRAEESDGFYGDFAKARGMLNYSFHNNYTKERQEWQNMIIQSVCVRSDPQLRPWLVFTCGTPGAGKGYVMSWLSQQGYFPLENIVHVDPDFFKMSMPEWPGYKAAGEASVDKVCGAEANMMADVAQFAAINRQQTVWRDSTLINGEFFKGQFKQLRSDFPHYKIAVFYITADDETVRQRVEDRARKTGRTVDKSYLEDAFKQIRSSLTTVSDVVDFIATIDNSGSRQIPLLESFRIVDHSHDWAIVRQRFAQRQANPAEFPTALAPMYIKQTQWIAGNSTFDHAKKTLILRSEEHGDIKVQVSTLSPLTIDSETKEQLKIPKEQSVSRFCFVYAATAGFTRGGFAYFGASDDLVCLNQLSVDTDEKVPSFIQYGPPVSLSRKTVAHMRKDRLLQKITFQHLKDAGAQYVCWISPGEKLPGGFVDSGHGGFAYVMQDESEHRYFPVASITGGASAG